MAILKGDSKNNTLNGSVENDTLYGYFGDDILNGGNGDDKLDGGSGTDKLAGGIGNDIYSVDNIGDIVIEKASAGTDKVISSVSWTLGINVENLILAGNSALNGTGNNLNNLITGNTSTNKLIGNAGNDTLDGSAGVDALYGGLGNDILKINDFNGDIIDGGSGKDTLEVYGIYQTLALTTVGNDITGIEKINFNGEGGTLTLNARSVIDLSSDSNSLTIDGNADDSLHLDSKWVNLGIRDGYRFFRQSGAVLYVNTSIDIVTDNSGTYKISTAAMATNLSGIFNTDVQEITIDFGDKDYSAWGLSSIDLSGFGLEDKLIIAQHDGALNNGTAAYGNGNGYIHEAQIFGSTSYSRQSTIEDNAVWQAGATKAALVSLRRYIGTRTDYYTYRSTTPSGSVFSSRYTDFLYSVQLTAIQGNIQLTGLPAGLADSQFVFI